ncbi:MAG: nucleotidyltransferase family protein, partial [Oscillospiraceae bacterium]|nr:nucleotidyltransferase family protein [Oscillospiraceae bacterium]
MTREEYRSALDDLICLVSCAVNGTAPDKERVLTMNQDNLYTAASRHMLTAIAGYALESAGVENEAFIQSKNKAVRKEILFDRELAAVRGKLEENGIRYMVLKGSVLKDCYPGIGMRQMADIDIFIDPAKREDVRRIMYEMGYKSPDLPKDEYLHDVYEKPPVYNFEMHTLLFGPTFSDRFSELNERFTKRLIRDDNEHRGFHFSDEDFYLYMIAHEYKHYSGGGTGLRSLLDTYVYLRRVPLDMAYVAREIEKLGIGDFEAANRSLALHLFGGEPLTEEEREMLDY